MPLSAEEKNAHFSKTHSHFQSSRQVLDQNEARSQVQLSSAQPPAATGTSTQTRTAWPCVEGLLGFPIFFFSFFWISAFRNLWASLFFVLPSDTQSMAYLHKIEKGRLTITGHLRSQGSGAPSTGLGIRNQAGTWAAQNIWGAMCLSLTEVILNAQGNSFSWGHLYLRLTKSSYTTKSPFLFFFVFISFHIGMRPP